MKTLKIIFFLFFFQAFDCYSATKKTKIPPPDLLIEIGTLLDTPHFSGLWHFEFNACVVNGLKGCFGVKAAFRTSDNDATTYPVAPIFVSYVQSFDAYLRGISINFLIGHNDRGLTGQLDTILLIGWRWVKPREHTSLYFGVGPRSLVLGETSLSGVMSLKLGYSL